MRVSLYPANIDNMPNRNDGVIIPIRAGDSGSYYGIDVGVSWGTAVDYHDSGVLRVIHRQGSGLLSVAGGEKLSVWLFFNGAFEVDAPDLFFWLLAWNPESSYVMYPTGWPSSAGPYPYLDDPNDILHVLDLQVSLPFLGWSELLSWYGPGALNPLASLGSACGKDRFGLDICADTLLYVDLPQDSHLYRQANTGLSVFNPVDFTIEHKPGIDSNMDTGIPQNDANYIGGPAILDAANDSTSSMDDDVRWDETAIIEGVHLWTYTDPNTPAPYRLSMCSRVPTKFVAVT